MVNVSSRAAPAPGQSCDGGRPELSLRRGPSPVGPQLPTPPPTTTTSFDVQCYCRVQAPRCEFCWLWRSPPPCSPSTWSGPTTVRTGPCARGIRPAAGRLRPTCLTSAVRTARPSAAPTAYTVAARASSATRRTIGACGRRRSRGCAQTARAVVRRTPPAASWRTAAGAAAPTATPSAAPTASTAAPATPSATCSTTSAFRRSDNPLWSF